MASFVRVTCKDPPSRTPMCRYTLSLVFLFLITGIHAQDQNQAILDSLWLEHADPKTSADARLEALDNIIYHMSYIDQDSSWQCVDAGASIPELWDRAVQVGCRRRRITVHGQFVASTLHTAGFGLFTRCRGHVEQYRHHVSIHGRSEFSHLQLSTER